MSVSVHYSLGTLCLLLENLGMNNNMKWHQKKVNSILFQAHRPLMLHICKVQYNDCHIFINCSSLVKLCIAFWMWIDE